MLNWLTERVISIIHIKVTKIRTTKKNAPKQYIAEWQQTCMNVCVDKKENERIYS